MTRKEAIAAVANIVCVDREDAYGAPEDNFARIAAINNVNGFTRNGQPLKPIDVALFMLGVKMGRLAHDINSTDGWIDGCGYSVCGASLIPEKTKEKA